MLDDIVRMLTQGVTFLGGVLVVFGLVNLGMTIKDGMQGGGDQLSGAIVMIVGGTIVVGAAIYFGQPNTGWAGELQERGGTYILPVAVHKDIAEYQPKVVGKMTGRTLASITGALGCSVLTGLYIYFALGWNAGGNMTLIYVVSLPFWCCGFIRPKGMPFERFAVLWLKANFGVERILYTPSMQLSGLVSPFDEKNTKKGRVYGRHYRKQCNLKGIEAYSLRAGRIID